MQLALRLAPLFLGILAALPACPFGCDAPTIESTQTYEVAHARAEPMWQALNAALWAA